jgi:hypothetical protein
MKKMLPSPPTHRLSWTSSGSETSMRRRRRPRRVGGTSCCYPPRRAWRPSGPAYGCWSGTTSPWPPTSTPSSTGPFSVVGVRRPPVPGARGESRGGCSVRAAIRGSTTGRSLHPRCVPVAGICRFLHRILTPQVRYPTASLGEGGCIARIRGPTVIAAGWAYFVRCCICRGLLPASLARPFSPGAGLHKAAWHGRGCCSGLDAKNLALVGSGSGETALSVNPAGALLSGPSSSRDGGGVREAELHRATRHKAYSLLEHWRRVCEGGVLPLLRSGSVWLLLIVGSYTSRRNAVHALALRHSLSLLSPLSISTPGPSSVASCPLFSRSLAPECGELEPLSLGQSDPSSTTVVPPSLLPSPCHIGPQSQTALTTLMAGVGMGQHEGTALWTRIRFCCLCHVLCWRPAAAAEMRESRVHSREECRLREEQHLTAASDSASRRAGGGGVDKGGSRRGPLNRRIRLAPVTRPLSRRRGAGSRAPP